MWTTPRVPDSRTPASGRSSGNGPTAPYTPDSSTREFVDDSGRRWAVREIIPETRPTVHRTLLTRPGYENGWLSFRCASLACRIAPYPEDWRTISDYELERWCMKAQDRARVRRPGSGDGERR
jgi:hypothetical protein